MSFIQLQGIAVVNKSTGVNDNPDENTIILEDISNIKLGMFYNRVDERFYNSYEPKIGKFTNIIEKTIVELLAEKEAEKETAIKNVYDVLVTAEKITIDDVPQEYQTVWMDF